MKRLAAFALALALPVLGWAQTNTYMAFAPGTAPSYEGLWWNPSESGWGVSIAHQGDVLFGVWYTYDQDGSPMWLVMPDARLVSDDMESNMGMMDMEMMGPMRNPPIYTGLLYRSSMQANRLVMTEVGMGTFLFKDKTHGVFAYTVGNVSQSKMIERMAFGSSNQECTLGGAKAASDNFQDLWWNPADSGWGVNIAHQGDILFATYYTYDANGKGEWFVMPDTARSGATGYAGPIYRARGPAFDSVWDATRVVLTEVGSATFGFDGSGGSFKSTVAGSAATRPITRMSFASPVTSCH